MKKVLEFEKYDCMEVNGTIPHIFFPKKNCSELMLLPKEKDQISNIYKAENIQYQANTVSYIKDQKTLYSSSNFVGGALKFYDKDSSNTNYVLIGDFPTFEQDTQYLEFGKIQVYFGAPRAHPTSNESSLQVRTLWDDMFPVIQIQYDQTINVESSIDYFDWLINKENPHFEEYTKQNATWYFKNQNEIIIDLQPLEEESSADDQDQSSTEQ